MKHSQNSQMCNAKINSYKISKNNANGESPDMFAMNVYPNFHVIQ